jgi:hypothetical protein
LAGSAQIRGHRSATLNDDANCAAFPPLNHPIRRAFDEIETIFFDFRETGRSVKA